MIVRLLDQPDTMDLEYVLVNAFDSAIDRVRKDPELSRKIAQRIEALKRLHQISAVT